METYESSKIICVSGNSIMDFFFFLLGIVKKKVVSFNFRSLYFQLGAFLHQFMHFSRFGQASRWPPEMPRRQPGMTFFFHIDVENNY
jgi:hypothetical protein